MIKIILLTIALYIFIELMCHGFAIFVRRILNKTVVQDHRKALHLQFIQQTFYRLMLILSIVLMNHAYTEMAFFEQSDVVRFTWSAFVIVLILFIFWWINAFIIRQVLQSQQQQSVTATFKQKVSYIMFHPKEFQDSYINTTYLEKSKWINRILSVLAFILLFMDLQLLFNIAHS
ncbi:hypothetical protein BEN71_18900 [Acinetobacter wuhouensis]|uniref:hypothetical protein n=1 Tax=Acinetobacter wuhouensis TaxID=1879050 RepID=UPI00083B1717|nr:hypothetical protein [Acinetobacter wuhouensis]AXQ23988.1 hypothetical protein BEN71_18900 [Acinetobacter wuhouensis]